MKVSHVVLIATVVVATVTAQNFSLVTVGPGSTSNIEEISIKYAVADVADPPWSPMLALNHTGNSLVAAIPMLATEMQFVLYAKKTNKNQWYVHCGGVGNGCGSGDAKVAASLCQDNYCCCSDGNAYEANFVIHAGSYAISIDSSPSGAGTMSLSKKGNITCAAGPSPIQERSTGAHWVEGKTWSAGFGSPQTCSSNGICGPYPIECRCFGHWQGKNCSFCGCPGDSACQGWTGKCASVQPSTGNRYRQGVIVLLLDISGYTKPDRRSTTVYAAINNFTLERSRWRDYDAFCAKSGSPALKNFLREALGPRLANYTDCDRWMISIIPANQALFVIYNNQTQDYVHCQSVVPASSGAECHNDHHDEKMNFFASSGIVSLKVGAAVEDATLTVMEEFPVGCQYGQVAQNISGDSPSLCSSRGECTAATGYSCKCRGNYGGPACSECFCRQPHETCNLEGDCVCSSGTMRCNGVCTDTTSNKDHCGSCENECGGKSNNVRQSIELDSVTCRNSKCYFTMKPKFDWTICFGEDNVHIACFKGYAFIIIACVAGVLCLVCGWCYRQYRTHCPNSHTHRQAMFLLLAVIGAIRMIYAVAAIIVISTIKSPSDARRGIGFFERSMITLNAYGDLFTGMIDLLLTTYWMFALGKVTAFPKKLLAVLYGGMMFTLTIATIVDYQNSPTTFNYTFFTIAIVLFFTALLHLSVIFEVIMKLRQWKNQKIEEGTSLLNQNSGSFRQSLTSGAVSADAVQSHLVRVSAIAGVCFACWGFRAVMLLGRATQSWTFTRGKFSFANADFTLLYYTVLSLLPCIIIAVAFFALSFDVLRNNGPLSNNSMQLAYTRSSRSLEGSTLMRAAHEDSSDGSAPEKRNSSSN